MAAPPMSYEAAEAATVALAAALLPAHQVYTAAQAVRLFVEARQEVFAERARQCRAAGDRVAD